MTGLIVVSVGLCATVQDAGRSGQFRYGLTEAGAADGFNYRLGQRLVGNSPGSAVIEIALGGITVEFQSRHIVAVTGATGRIWLESLHNALGSTVQEQHPNCSFCVEAGQRLTLEPTVKGVYGYLSIAGGIDTPPVFGSRSTVVREGIGGLEGRNLRSGDWLGVGEANAAPTSIVHWKGRPRQTSKELRLRFVPGFQYESMTPASRQGLETARFCVSPQRDRMGARMAGVVPSTDIRQLLSEATCLGAIQIPPDGQPIVLLHDRQTLGGYPKAGAVIESDCERLAQAPVGTAVYFQPISGDDADRVSWLEGNFEREMVLEQVL